MGEEIGSLVSLGVQVPQQSPSVNAISCRNCPCCLMKQIARSFPLYLISDARSLNGWTFSWVTATRPCVKWKAFQRTAHQEEVTQLLMVGKASSAYSFPHTLARL